MPANIQITNSTPVISQVRKVDPVPAPTLNASQHSNQQLNSSNLSGEEGGPCPRPTLNASQHSNQQLNSTNLSGEEGGPCPRPTLNASHIQINNSTPVISQVRLLKLSDLVL